MFYLLTYFGLQRLEAHSYAFTAPVYSDFDLARWHWYTNMTWRFWSCACVTKNELSSSRLSRVRAN